MFKEADTLINNPFKLSPIDFRDWVHEDWRHGLRRPPDIRVEVHEQHQERFNPAIFEQAPSSWDKAFHRQSYVKNIAKESVARVERRHQFEVKTIGQSVASYRATQQRIDQQTFGQTLERLYTQRQLLARQRFGGGPAALPVRGSLQDQLNEERQMNHLATVIFERNPHAFAQDPVLKLAGLPAYSWPQLTAVNHTAITVSVKT